jgi:hypothetical protein
LRVKGIAPDGTVLVDYGDESAAIQAPPEVYPEWMDDNEE